MRLAIYLCILLSLLPLCLLRPFLGLCVYYVVSLLQPKFLCWHPSLQDAMIAGVPLIIGAVAFGIHRRTLVAVRDRRSREIASAEVMFERSPLFEPSWLLAACFLLFVYITAMRAFSEYPLAVSSAQYRSLGKILMVMALMTGLACDYRRLRILYLVVALATGFWAIKGGLKVILLGPHQVYGKTYDNNLFALTTVMTLPMVFYFALSVRHTLWRTGLLACAGLMCLAIIGSRSRAGFVALACVLVGMAWSSRYRLRALGAVALLGIAVMVVSFGEIRERIDSILAYQSDVSAMSRFFTWEQAWQLLKEHPLFGVGFNNFEVAREAVFGGKKAVHSIFLQNLVELGLIGHPLWLAVVLGGTISVYRFMRRARRLPQDFRWAYHWSRGLMLGLVAFCVHGLFHNEEYLELMFVLVGLGICLKSLTRRMLSECELEQFDLRQRTPTYTNRRPASDPIAVHPGRLAPAS